MIIITLNAIFTVTSLDIGGYGGDSNLWNSNNGCNAKISLSEDGSNWEEVGQLPSNYGKSIQKLKLLRPARCKFIQFQSTSYLGIGYLKVNTDGNSSLSSSIVDNFRARSSFANLSDSSNEVIPIDIGFVPYIYNGRQIGGSNVRDLCEGSLKTGKLYFYFLGICSTKPGLITFTLNQVADINTVKIGGWTGNTNTWFPANGVGSKIFTSVDKNNWTEVGTIPNSFGDSIITVNVTPTRGKYVQFQHNNYIGLGYFKVESGSGSNSDFSNDLSRVSMSSNLFNSTTHPCFSNFWFNAPYVYNGKTAGTNQLGNVADRSLSKGKITIFYFKGICSINPGWIIFQLNYPRSVNSIEVGGFTGEKQIWFPGNGAGAAISTSIDKVTWKNVGVVPNNFGEGLMTINLISSSANFIKFELNAYIGFGYVNIVS